MRDTRTLSVSLLLMIVTAFLSGCGGSQGAWLEGRYVSQNTGFYLDFHADGSVLMSAGRSNTSPVQGTYKVTADSVEIFVKDVGPLPVEPGEPVMVFKMSGEDLIGLRGNTKWVKQKDANQQGKQPKSDL